MKNLLFFILIITLTGSASLAQDKGYIAVSVGPSIPTGDFASKDMGNESAGFANTGAIFDISFGYKIGKNFGVSALLRGQANNADAQAISDEMAKRLTPGINNTVSAGSWGVGGLLVGGYASFPIIKQLSFESRLMTGFVSATSPGMTINLSSQSSSAWVKQSSSSGIGLAYLAGIGIKYDVASRVCLISNIDFLGSNLQFDDVELTNSLGAVEKNSYTQTFGAVNIGFGVGYRL
jgi:hypothetical protein